MSDLTETPRQRQMLLLLASGMTYKEVAAHLGIAPTTVRNGVRMAYERLGVQTATPGGHSLMEAFRALGWLRAPSE